MNVKSYSLEVVSKAGETLTLNYGYSLRFRKWAFVFGGDSILVACHGGEQGHKVAKIIAGAIKRGNGMDNLARANIATVLRPTVEA